MKQQGLLPLLLAGMVEDVPAIAVNGMTLDNRRVQPGMAFVALQGTRQHGLAYAEAAVQAGAVAIVFEPVASLQIPSLAVPLIPVPGLREKLGLLAKRFYAAPADRLFMVGVTGTDGKTSVTHFIAEALNAHNHQAAVIGTLGIGLPGQLQPATHTTPDAWSVHHLLQELKSQDFQIVAI